MVLFLYSSSLLYLTIHLECFEVEQICFSFPVVYFVKINVFMFVGFLIATFVWPFLHLMFLSDILIIFRSHAYLVLVCCFLCLAFQSCFLAFLFLLFWYKLRLLVIIIFKLIESCHQACFRLAGFVGAVFVLLL